MDKRKKRIITAAACLVLLLITAVIFIGNPVVFRNNQKLGKAVAAISAEKVQLNDVVPFDWDLVYTFEPYVSREYIEEAIGFHSWDIKENNINEGMVQLLFVKEKRVVASVLGYPQRLGYSIDFESKVTRAENAVFSVEEKDGIKVLTLEK